jgi:hypothetical protein
MIGAHAKASAKSVLPTISIVRAARLGGSEQRPAAHRRRLRSHKAQPVAKTARPINVMGVRRPAAKIMTPPPSPASPAAANAIGSTQHDAHAVTAATPAKAAAPLTAFSVLPDED